MAGVRRQHGQRPGDGVAEHVVVGRLAFDDRAEHDQGVRLLRLGKRRARRGRKLEGPRHAHDADIGAPGPAAFEGRERACQQRFRDRRIPAGAQHPESEPRRVQRPLDFLWLEGGGHAAGNTAAAQGTAPSLKRTILSELRVES